MTDLEQARELMMRMTDLELERAAWSVFKGDITSWPKQMADALAAARREGAEEMRERAAREADLHDPYDPDLYTWSIAERIRAVRALPLTPEEPPKRQPVAPSADPDVSVCGRLIASHPIVIPDLSFENMKAVNAALAAARREGAEAERRAALRAGTETRHLLGMGMTTKALDAAARALAHIEDGEYGEMARAALRAALPADPPEDVIEEAIEGASEYVSSVWRGSKAWDTKEYAIAQVATHAAYRALRAHLLGEDA